MRKPDFSTNLKSIFVAVFQNQKKLISRIQLFSKPNQILGSDVSWLELSYDRKNSHSNSISNPLQIMVFQSLTKDHPFADMGNEIISDHLDLTGLTDFQRAVYLTLVRIPAGKTISYSELAIKAGFPGAGRAVGSAMRKNPFPIVFGCHRVILKSGQLGQYSAGSVDFKKWLLQYEAKGFD